MFNHVNCRFHPTGLRVPLLHPVSPSVPSVAISPDGDDNGFISDIQEHWDPGEGDTPDPDSPELNTAHPSAALLYRL